ncbi:MAG: lysophospholipid acyltransferase family protein [Planctomycetota bacterium]
MNTGEPTVSAWDARAGSRLRCLVVFLPCAAFAFGYTILLLLYAFLAPASCARHRARIIHPWGRTALWMLGIRLEVHGREHLAWPGALIVMFNHQSLLDLFVLSALWPPQATVVYKKEFERVPLIGRTMKALGMISIDRSRGTASFRSLAEVSQRIRTEGLLLFIAPEGTRSRSGGLQAFKMGPFHLAALSKAPVIPMILRGIPELLPMGSRLARTGRIRVDFLPPIDTRDWEPSRVRQHAVNVRQIFLRHLPPARSKEERE